jgi:hypothetical protein
MDAYATMPPVYNLNGFEIAVLTIVIILIIAYYAWKWWTQFSEEEINELSDIMMNFHKNPSRDDFTQVWGERVRLIRQTGEEIKYWCYGVYLTHPEFFDDDQKRELNTWVRDIERGLRRARLNPTSKTIDCIWSLYFATGRTEYSNIVKNIALGDDSVPYYVKSAAKWSYRSIMKRRPDQTVDEPAEPDEPAEAPDVIILPDAPAKEVTTVAEVS